MTLAVVLSLALTAQLGCTAPPPATAGFAASITGSVVTLTWPSAANADRYFIRAGWQPGSREFGPFDVGAVTIVTITAPPGTYYVVLNAFNGCGASADSNEIVVRVPQIGPSPFSIEMPIAAGDTARESFGLNPFGIHFGGSGAGGHGLDGHPGWDIEYRLGGVVRTAADGIVQSRFADPFAPDRVTVQLHHQRGALAFRTVYTNLAGGFAAIEPGAAVTAGQPLGFAGSQTLFIGTEQVTFAMTHFQVDDFRRNEGLTNPSAANPEEFLSASGAAIFDAIWRTAAYTVEITEPFPGNPRNASFPIVRGWTRQSGMHAEQMVFVRTSASNAAHDYVLYDAGGIAVEQGSAALQVTRSGVQIDLQPHGGGSSRRGLVDVVGDTMRIDYGVPGGPRPPSLTSASVYRTPR